MQARLDAVPASPVFCRVGYQNAKHSKSLECFRGPTRDSPADSGVFVWRYGLTSFEGQVDAIWISHWLCNFVPLVSCSVFVRMAISVACEIRLSAEAVDHEMPLGQERYVVGIYQMPNPMKDVIVGLREQERRLFTKRDVQLLRP